MAVISVELDYDEWARVCAALLMVKNAEYTSIMESVRAQVTANPKGYPGA